jgi:hypothetical protein
MALERDYLVGLGAAKRWLEQESLMLPLDKIESLVRTIVDAVDAARERRQQEH